MAGIKNFRWKIGKNENSWVVGFGRNAGILEQKACQLGQEFQNNGSGFSEQNGKAWVRNFRTKNCAIGSRISELEKWELMVGFGKRG